jgi:CHAT domain-containing protein/tetratricopeptide (TPR) repeat protein
MLQIVALSCLFLLFNFSAFAQDAHSNELNEQVVKLFQQGRYDDAFHVAREALQVAETTFGLDDPRVATPLGNLAQLFEHQHEYDKAEPLLARKLAIQQKKLNPDDPHIAQSFNDLADVYQVQGRYEEALSLLSQALKIWLKTEGRQSPIIASVLSDVGSVLLVEGGDADTVYLEALKIRQNTLPPDDPLIAQSLDNLAAFYVSRHRYEEAGPLYKQALAILQKEFGSDDRRVAEAMNGIATVYQYQKRYGEAEELFRQALAIDKKTLDADHPIIAIALSNLALLYVAQALYREAEPLLIQALEISQKGAGPTSSGTETKLFNLGMLYYAWGRPRTADIYFDRALKIRTEKAEQQISYMPEEVRLGFLDTFSSEFARYLSFASSYHNQDSQLAGRAYDLQLWEKGLVADSVATRSAQFASSDDAVAKTLVHKLTIKRNQYAALVGAELRDPEQRTKDLIRLQQEANDLEGQLERRSDLFAKSERLKRPSWRDVQKVLGKNEAAVEVVHFEYNDGKKFTGRAKYAALVLTAASKSGPLLIDLGDAASLETALQSAYYQRVVPDSNAAALDCSAKASAPLPPATLVSATRRDPLGFYKSFWRPLELALGGAKRIYISTDGKLNQVALGLIPTSKGNSLLMERYDLRLLDRTADLLLPTPEHNTKSAALFANPDFSLDEVSYRKSLAVFGDPPVSSVEAAIPTLGESRTTLGGCTQLAQVRGLEIGVVSQIAPLLRGHGWTVKTYLEEQALVETVEQIQAPRLLHIATHGDFLPDPVSNSPKPMQKPFAQRPLYFDPMLRSRLFFAGANQTLAGRQLPAGLSDGILTAYQASTMNLHGTELVVLSACETGRGDVWDGEGVLGLRRAFQEAGAESVLMTLWEVPSLETQELLNDFYHHWLEDGMNKHQALFAAQEDERAIVRKRYGSELPYYWGAFILIGR